MTKAKQLLIDSHDFCAKKLFRFFDMRKKGQLIAS